METMNRTTAPTPGPPATEVPKATPAAMRAMATTLLQEALTGRSASASSSMSPTTYLRRAGGAATGAPAARTSRSRTTAQAGPWGTRCPGAGSAMSPSSRAYVRQRPTSSSGSTAAWRSRSAPRTSARRSASAASPRRCFSWWTGRDPWGPRTGWWPSRAPYCRC